MKLIQSIENMGFSLADVNEADVNDYLRINRQVCGR